MFEVEFDRQAAHFLKKIPSILFERISEKLKILESNPVPHDAKRMVNYPEPVFRIRIGKYRAVYRINYQENKVVVVKIDHRKRVY